MWPGPPRVEQRMAHIPPPVGPRRSFGRGRMPLPPGPLTATPGMASQRLASANNAAIASLLPMSVFNFGNGGGGPSESRRPPPRPQMPPQRQVQSAFPPPPPHLVRGGPFPSQNNNIGTPHQNAPVFTNGQFIPDGDASQNFFNTRSPASNYRPSVNNEFNNNYGLRQSVPVSMPNSDPGAYHQRGAPMPPFGNPAMYSGMQRPSFRPDMSQSPHGAQFNGMRMPQPPRMPLMPQPPQMQQYNMPTMQQQHHPMGQFAYNVPVGQPNAARQPSGLLTEPTPTGAAIATGFQGVPNGTHVSSVSSALPMNSPSIPDAEDIPMPSAPAAAYETTNQQRQLAKVRLLQPLTRKKPNLNKDGEAVNPSEVVPIFIGNMDDRVSEVLIRNLLGLCGSVHNWRRVQSPQANFGFCDFGSAEAACRTVRLMDGLVLGGKTLNVKIGNKNPDRVVQYKREILTKLGMPTDAPVPESNKFRVDPATRAVDEECKAALRAIISTHQEELSRHVAASSNIAVFIGSSRQTPSAKEENPAAAKSTVNNETSLTNAAAVSKADSKDDLSQSKSDTKSDTFADVAPPRNVGHLKIEEEKLDIVTEQIQRFREEAARKQHAAMAEAAAAPTKTIEIRLQPPKSAATAARVNGDSAGAATPSTTAVSSKTDISVKQNVDPIGNTSPQIDNTDKNLVIRERTARNSAFRSRSRHRSRSSQSSRSRSRRRDNRAKSRSIYEDRQGFSRSRSRSTTARNRQKSSARSRSRSISNDSRAFSSEQRRFNSSRSNLQQHGTVSPSPERQRFLERRENVDRHATHVRDADDRLEHKFNKRLQHRLNKERDMSSELNIETDKLKDMEERRRRLIDSDVMRRRKEEMDDQSRKRKLFEFLSLYDDDVEDTRYFSTEAMSLLCERYAKEQRVDATARAESQERHRREDEQKKSRLDSASRAKSKTASDQASPTAAMSSHRSENRRKLSQTLDIVEGRLDTSPHAARYHRNRRGSSSDADSAEEHSAPSPEDNADEVDVDEKSARLSPKHSAKGAGRRNSELSRHDITAREAKRSSADESSPQNDADAATANGRVSNRKDVFHTDSKKKRNSSNGAMVITSAAAFRQNSEDENDDEEKPSADENVHASHGRTADEDAENAVSAAETDDGAPAQQPRRAPGTFASEKEFAHNLIRHIPNDLEGVFQWELDPPMIDQVLIDRKIRPWVDKKMAAFFGSPEPDITEYVCKSLLEQKNAHALHHDVSEFLEDEASNFMLNLWRKLIYEVEARKHGFGVAQI